jgi:hypothetical protein
MDKTKIKGNPVEVVEKAVEAASTIKTVKVHTTV